MNYAIEIDNVWKKYRLYQDRSTTFKERVLFRNRGKYQEHTVLKGINLKIEKGKSLGLIGENGSGKSTLLKLMSRIIYPDQGNITMIGKVSSLLELGAGFHQDFTGLENIYMNAAIFGLQKKEIDKKLNNIIEFSELGKFIDSPVRTYSSGMYMRLAFSIAINVEPEILLIDEILAVGDDSFQRKCFSKMQEFSGSGCTLVIVSHSLNDIKKVCNEVVWLNKGKLELIGEPDYVIDQYKQESIIKDVEKGKSESLEISKADNNKIIDSSPERDKLNDMRKTDSGGVSGVGTTPDRWGSQEAVIDDVKILNIRGEETILFPYSEDITILIKYKVNSIIRNVVFGLGIFLRDGTRCYGTNTDLAGIKIEQLEPGQEGYVRLNINRVCLVDGEYLINLAIHNKEGFTYDYHHRLYDFRIFSGSKDIGIMRPQVNWQIY